MSKNIPHLINIIRYNPNPNRCHEALSELRQAGSAAAAFGNDLRTARSEESNTPIDQLLDVIRECPDREQRSQALAHLYRLGLADPL